MSQGSWHSLLGRQLGEIYMYVWMGSVSEREKDAGLEVRGLWRSEVVAM